MIKQFNLQLHDTLTGPVTCELERNSNEGVLHIHPSFRIGVLQFDGFVLYTGHLLFGYLPLCRDTVDVFNSPNRLGYSSMSLSMIHIRKQYIWLYTGRLKKNVILFLQPMFRIKLVLGGAGGVKG